jgi:hypothetical protein
MVKQGWAVSDREPKNQKQSWDLAKPKVELLCRANIEDVPLFDKRIKTKIELSVEIHPQWESFTPLRAAYSRVATAGP